MRTTRRLRKPISITRWTRSHSHHARRPASGPADHRDGPAPSDRRERSPCRVAYGRSGSPRRHGARSPRVAARWIASARPAQRSAPSTIATSPAPNTSGARGTGASARRIRAPLRPTAAEAPLTARADTGMPICSRPGRLSPRQAHSSARRARLGLPSDVDLERFEIPRARREARADRRQQWARPSQRMIRSAPARTDSRAARRSRNSADGPRHLDTRRPPTITKVSSAARASGFPPM